MEGDIIGEPVEPPKSKPPRDRHAGDKKKLAGSHQRTKLPEEPEQPTKEPTAAEVAQNMKDWNEHTERKEEPEQPLEEEPPTTPPQPKVEPETPPKGDEERPTQKKLQRIPKEVAIAQGWPPASDWDFLTKGWTGEEQAFLLQLVGWAKQKYTLAGPYKKEKGGPQYVIYNGETHVKDTRDEKVVKVAEQIWKQLGGTFPTEKPKEKEVGLTVEEIATSIEAQEAPYTKTIARRFSWWEMGLHDLGDYTYNRLAESGLLKMDDWYVNPVPGSKEDEANIQKTAQDKFHAASGKALDTLLKALPEAKGQKAKEDDLTIQLRFADADIRAYQRKVKELEWDSRYWQQYGRLATQMMPPELLASFHQKITILTKLEGMIKETELQSLELNAKMAAASKLAEEKPSG